MSLPEIIRESFQFVALGFVYWQLAKAWAAFVRSRQMFERMNEAGQANFIMTGEILKELPPKVRERIMNGANWKHAAKMREKSEEQ